MGAKEANYRGRTSATVYGTTFRLDRMIFVAFILFILLLLALVVLLTLVPMFWAIDEYGPNTLALNNNEEEGVVGREDCSGACDSGIGPWV